MSSPKENAIIYADAQRCLGCHSCELACAVAHSDGHTLNEAVALNLPLHPRNTVIVADGVMMPMQCRQCEDAPCAHVCPTGACRQADGQVKIVEENCVGCKLCVMVCPFGVITVQADRHRGGDDPTNRGVALKCDLCESWRADTGNGDPACVAACPTRAIQLVNLEDYRKALIQARARELAHSHRHMPRAFP
ncbi:4Fe-4S dicluster domain-containing protein [Azospirillum sp. YIM B02556]|uniref:4Fe-4S dicluster domain-containing protein n=1 Tax=Azospirillum endophyticum TaxID=2800326 RepID=A0ABS1FC85_9PROT|nr:4Fe-4S dicluster domain-containing protein [Azospirillum endophyticum]MBK1841015.1 4Fe-4S dicluster domain-containing protein [Azospirillum endophyticum]